MMIEMDCYPVTEEGFQYTDFKMYSNHKSNFYTIRVITESDEKADGLEFMECFEEFETMPRLGEFIQTEYDERLFVVSKIINKRNSMDNIKEFYLTPVVEQKKTKKTSDDDTVGSIEI